MRDGRAMTIGSEKMSRAKTLVNPNTMARKTDTDTRDGYKRQRRGRRHNARTHEPRRTLSSPTARCKSSINESSSSSRATSRARCRARRAARFSRSLRWVVAVRGGGGEVWVGNVKGMGGWVWLVNAGAVAGLGGMGWYGVVGGAGLVMLTCVRTLCRGRLGLGPF